ncbi:MAG: hypothetical protein ABEJ74_05380 [Haloferacaceae archaeon]
MKVALRGGGADAVRAVEDAGGAVVDPADADVLLALDEPALLSLASDPVDCPVLVVTPGGSLHAVPRARLDAALDSLFSGDYRTFTHPILGVSIDGEAVTRAVTDVTLLTAEPARISEYAVRTHGETVDQFRADGVVVATPLGSTGYTENAGGSAVTAGVGLPVVPLSPFSTHARTWVLDPPLTLTIERDESDVVLVADDREVQGVRAGVPVELVQVDAFELVRVPEVGD